MSSSYGAPWQISTMSSTSTGPFGNAPSHARFSRSQIGDRPLDRLPRDLVEPLHTLESRRNLVVIATDDRPDPKATHALDDSIGVGAVADEIAQHERAVVAGGRRQRRLERLEVGVNVAQDEIFHVPLISNPLEQPLHNFGSRPRGIDSDVRVGVCDAVVARRAVPTASDRRRAAVGHRVGPARSRS